LTRSNCELKSKNETIETARWIWVRIRVSVRVMLTAITRVMLTPTIRGILAIPTNILFNTKTNPKHQDYPNPNTPQHYHEH
jgi:hypothetical protein